MTTPDPTLADAVTQMLTQIPIHKALSELGLERVKNNMLEMENAKLRSALAPGSEVSDNGHVDEPVPAETD